MRVPLLLKLITYYSLLDSGSFKMIGRGLLGKWVGKECYCNASFRIINKSLRYPLVSLSEELKMKLLSYLKSH